MIINFEYPNIYISQFTLEHLNTSSSSNSNVQPTTGPQDEMRGESNIETKNHQSCDDNDLQLASSSNGEQNTFSFLTSKYLDSWK